MLFTVFKWIWLVLIVVGAVLLVLRPIRLRAAEKNPLTARAKGFLWFLQALGFWAIVIGGWMRLEGIIVDLLEGEEGDEDEDTG